MPRYYLSTLSIEGFRGINNQGNPLVLKFDRDKVTSVFGANGMGKSSIFEALEYAIFGRVNRLEEMQQIENPDRYYLNQFHPGPARMILEFEPADSGVPVTITIERAKNGRRTVTGQNTTDADAFLKSIQAETLLMDYRTFNKFLMETPLERGRFLARLLGLERITAVRASLTSLSDTRNLTNDLDVNALRVKLQGAQSNRRSSVITALTQLSDVTAHSVTADTFDLKHVANLCLATLNSDSEIRSLIADKSLSQIDYKACLERLQQSDRTGERAKLADLHAKRGRVLVPVDLQSLEPQLATLRLEVQKRKELVDNSKGEAFRALYKATQQVLSTPFEANACPLCEREWEHASGLDLPQFVASQLGSYREILELDETITVRWKSLVDDISVSKLVAELQAKLLEAAPAAAFRSVDIPTEQDVRALHASFRLIEEHRVNALNEIQRSINEVEASLPPSLAASIQAVTAAKNLTDTLRAYLNADNAETTVSVELDAIEHWRAFIGEATSDFAQKETALVRATIAMLEEDIRTLYTAIMPAAHVLPKLSRQEGSERLLLMLEQFYGVQGAHAVPLLSESYRNALGLAVFLAASHKRNHGGRFLVLDDVTSSFDAGHQTYLLEAIYAHVALPENADGLQIIILSHDGALKRYFDMATSSKAWTNHKLQGTAPTGTVTTKVVPREQLRHDITQPLSTGDLDTARRAVRPFLEASLLHIIDQVHIRVPLELALVDRKRMLGDMMETIKWEISLRAQANVLILENSAVKDITQTVIPFLQANAWAHYATDAATSVDAHVIKGVVDSIDRLTDAFKYTCNCRPDKPERKFFRSLAEKQKTCGPTCK